ncbi:hypothetical protein [Embleya sp. NBC_00896]|uniref:hypothetical protein n=1 Tax=Embleya sp. NBC_00896 TaxID=2975961 RepID=UPI002F91628F|nr:hypothetical protein OG928_42565 [Embleya sp. NBC_00896]
MSANRRPTRRRNKPATARRPDKVAVDVDVDANVDANANVDVEHDNGATAVQVEHRHDGASVPAMSSEVIEAALYRAAEGNYAAQATAYILTEEGSFVRRPDLYAVCLDWSDDGRFASVQWHTLREVVTGTNAPYPDGSLRTMLLLCCSLHDDGPAPLSQLSLLDTTNARIVSRGIHIATGRLPLREALGNTR